LVDDELAVREALSELLATFGIAVRCFGSAREYLKHARVDEAACLVLDIQLPDIDGLELQRQIAAMGPPIVFITGHGDIPGSVQAMKAGAVEFLTKPVDTEALLAAVRVAFKRDRVERARAANLSELQRRLATLTPREREVLPLVLDGMLVKQAAWSLGISEVTMQVHRGQIMRKLQARSYAELVRFGEKLQIRAPQTPEASAAAGPGR
jgi:FixJ family two-component response regulator